MTNCPADEGAFSASPCAGLGGAFGNEVLIMSRAYMPQAKTVEWETPQAFFDRLDAEFGFVLDAAATRRNTKCPCFLGYDVNDIFRDGLVSAWSSYGGPVWCNPPYGKALAKWVKKAHFESQENPHPIVMLLPVRSDTKWWHEYVMQADEIRFVRGRLKFGGSKVSATFPSCVVVFRAAIDCKGGKPRISTMEAKQTATLPSVKPITDGNRPKDGPFEV